MLRFRPPAAAVLAITTVVGLGSFLWPFVADHDFSVAHGQQAPWLFAVVLGLLTLVVLAEATSIGLDAKTIAVLGVLAAVGPGATPQMLAVAAVDTISRFGTAFNENRYFHITWLVLPVIGLLERAGLQERARILIRQVRAATAGRLLLVYFMVRQATAALGLCDLEPRSRV